LTCLFVSAGTCLPSSYLAIARVLLTCLPAVTKQRLLFTESPLSNGSGRRSTSPTGRTKLWYLVISSGVFYSES
jgi:hypothetical protein